MADFSYGVDKRLILVPDEKYYSDIAEERVRNQCHVKGQYDHYCPVKNELVDRKYAPRCHSERSEESRDFNWALRFAQGDRPIRHGFIACSKFNRTVVQYDSNPLTKYHAEN